MPKRLEIKAHLSIEELEKRYRQSSEAIERSRYQIVWLLAKGLLTEEVASVTSYQRATIRRIAARYNKNGPDGLRDRRRDHPGRSTMLSELQSAQLYQALSSPPEDGGLWNGRKVAEKISELVGRPVSRQRGWEYLKNWNLRWRTPRPQHNDSNLKEQLAWKKNSCGR